MSKNQFILKLGFCHGNKNEKPISASRNFFFKNDYQLDLTRTDEPVFQEPPLMTKCAKSLGIKAKSISLDFEGKPVFKAMDFTIPPTEFVGLLGQSGIGKTSLLKIIAGLLKPDSGEISGSDGKSLKGRITYMAQQDLLFPWLNVIDNVCLGARLRGEKKDYSKASQLLEKVGLLAIKNQLPETLSGGMRQRVAIARTLYEDRPVVLMDEPFSALDAVTRANIQELAFELLRHKTVLLVTHDPSEAARLCHRILVLQGEPANFLPAIVVEGAPPRNYDDKNRLTSETQLMHLLKGI